MVEPLAGVFGAFAVVLAEPLLPYALAFAAGAMVYVVMDDIIPEAQIRLKSIPSPICARLFPKPGARHTDLAFPHLLLLSLLPPLSAASRDRPHSLLNCVF